MTPRKCTPVAKPGNGEAPCIAVRFDHELLRVLRVEAELRGVSIAAVIRGLVDLGLTRDV